MTTSSPSIRTEVVVVTPEEVETFREDPPERLARYRKEPDADHQLSLGRAAQPSGPVADKKTVEGDRPQWLDYREA